MNISKNKIEMFTVSIKKRLSSKGPKNVKVSLEENTGIVEVYGYQTNLEREIIKLDMPLIKEINVARKQIFSNYCDRYKQEFIDLVKCDDVYNIDISFDTSRDVALVTFNYK